MVLLYVALAWLPFSRGLFTFEIYGATITVFIAIMLVLVFKAFYRVVGRSKNTSQFIVYALLLVINIQVVLMAFFSGELHPLYKYVHGLLVPSVAYFVIRNLIVTEKQFRLALLSIVFGVTAYSIAYSASFFGAGLQTRVDILNRNAIGVAASASFCMFLLIYTPLVRPIWRLAGSLPNFACLLATFSRAFLLAVVVSPLVFKWATGRRLLLTFVVFVVVTLIVTFISMENIEWFKPGKWDPKLENSVERILILDYWKNAIYGRLGSFKWAFLEFKRNAVFGNGFSTLGATVHNFHMEWLQITGLFGYAVLFAFFTLHFYYASKIGAADKYVNVISMYVIFMFGNGLMNGVMHGLIPTFLFVAMGLNDARLGMINAARRKMLRREGVGKMVTEEAR